MTEISDKTPSSNGPSNKHPLHKINSKEEIEWEEVQKGILR